MGGRLSGQPKPSVSRKISWSDRIRWVLVRRGAVAGTCEEERLESAQHDVRTTTALSPHHPDREVVADLASFPAAPKKSRSPSKVDSKNCRVKQRVVLVSHLPMVRATRERLVVAVSLAVPRPERVGPANQR